MATFPVEKAPTQMITGMGKLPDGGVMISKLLNYPVRGFVFEGGNSMRDLSDTVANSCIFLQNNNIPYNVLIADCGRRIFLFPQVILLCFLLPTTNLNCTLVDCFSCREVILVSFGFHAHNLSSSLQSTIRLSLIKRPNLAGTNKWSETKDLN